ncbi:hypothetical protein [Cellulomonas telluris]|uniref:hypothetical protein n=1 Tax=Cellulomonas telluris TaxID=2306636 RepID=UPI001FEC9CF0|nr:hypothetical protein [Cellulomonas telluris]
MEGYFDEAGQAAQLHVRDGEARARTNAVVPATERLVDYERSVICATGAAWFWQKGNVDGSCPEGGTPFPLTGCDGDTVLQPMWRRQRATTTAEWGQWQQVDSGGCGADVLPTLTAEDFRRLPIPAPVLNVQPAADWVLVNKETIVYTDPSPVTLTTDLLGYQVTVEATPTRFTYDFGDGTRPLVTTDPGAPYPAFDTFHVYRDLGTRQITLTTEWSGRYQVAGSPAWRDVDGTAQTTTTSPPFEVVERTSKLVAELCTAVPTPPDCG